MHIAITCPHCQSHYQVQSSLRGQHMRCPNPLCRAIFVVDGPGPTTGGTPGTPSKTPPPPAPSGTQRSGSVGEMIPVLPAESVEQPPPEPKLASSAPPRPTSSAHIQDVLPLLSAESVTNDQPPGPSEVYSWNQPPPVRNPSAPTPATPTPEGPPVRKPPVTAPSMPTPMPPTTSFKALPERRTQPAAPPAAKPPAAPKAGPVELAAGVWEAPPIRAPGLAPEQPVTAPVESAMPPVTAAPAPAAAGVRRRSRWMIAALLLLMAGGIGGGLWLLQGTRIKTETERYQAAVEHYQKRQFADAAYQFHNLEQDFPESPQIQTYHFLGQFSDIRDPIYSVAIQVDPEEAKRAWQGLRQFLNDHQGEPQLTEYQGDAWDTLYKLAEGLVELARQRRDADLLATAREVAAEGAKFQPVAGRSAVVQATEASFAEVERIIAAARFRQQLLVTLQNLAEQPTGDVVRRGRSLVKEASRQDTTLANDSEVLKLLGDLPARHRAQVKYTAVSAPPAPPPEEDTVPSLLVVPSGGPQGPPPRLGQRPVLALAPGVLYALEPDDGQVRWARRVSMDTMVLPLRLPRTPLSPAMVLVLSADNRTLTAVDAQSGVSLWRHQLQSPCLGRPVSVGDRVFVTTSEGRVDEVETAAGKLLGYYQLGEPLLGGGTHQPGTHLLYVPAETFSVYVLDVAKHDCAGILYTAHPSGSLRSPPVILPRPEQIVNESQAAAPPGLLVLSQSDSLDDMRLRTFALPLTGPDQPSLGSGQVLHGWSWFAPYHDGERVALCTDAGEFSVRGVSADSKDGLLPPLSETMFPRSTAHRSGRGQILHSNGQTFWVVAHGELHKLQTVFLRATGPSFRKLWQEPVPLGSPLHAGQVDVDGNGRTTLFAVTRLLDGSASLASAVDAANGTLRWQRRLGLLCQRPPLVVGDRVLALDQSGDLFLFGPDSPNHALGGPFSLGGQPLPSTGPKDSGTLVLLRGNASVYALAGTNRGSPASFTLRELQPGAESKVTVKDFNVQAPLAGTAAVGDDCLLMPLANGALVRQPLAGGPAVSGLNWRAPQADDTAPGHAVALGGSDFLVTDGSRKLRYLQWPAATPCEEIAVAAVDNRITSVPALLPGQGEGGEFRVCVADSANVVTVFQGRGLDRRRQWSLKGKITAGPFERAGKIGCVLNEHRLVWLDPAQEAPLWEHVHKAQLVGEPQLAGGMLVLADLQGRFLGLNPADGQPKGPGYTLKADVAAATAPVPWGEDRLFAPLTDGTVLLLPLGRLRAGP